MHSLHFTLKYDSIYACCYLSTTMSSYTDTSLLITFALNQFPSTKMNNHTNINYPMTTTTTITNTSLESSGSDQFIECSDFEGSEFFSFEQWLNEQEPVGVVQTVENYDVGGSNLSQNEDDSSTGNTDGKNRKEKVAFRMMSELDVVNDGYKWRKYGKKMVKNSPNPRNYYKCSEDGCLVKKRVERDRDDKRYVITTYEGHHNHQSPH